MVKHLLSMQDLSPEEIHSLLERASYFKKQRLNRILSDELKGKTIALIFQKPSTRTRVSFETGIHELGGNPLFLNAQELQLSRGETIADTARTLSRYVHGIVARVTSHNYLIELSKHGTIPVINALSPLEHPCQTLADLLTIREHKVKLKGLKLAWVSDGNNVCNSLLLGCTLVGINISAACPKGYEPPPEVVKQAQKNAAKSGAKIEILNDPKKAVTNANVVYSDVWVSMGQKKEAQKRLRAFKEYQINAKLLKLAKGDAIVMHCLPAHRGQEITAEVIDGPRSVVWDQAENRLHVQKAILYTAI
ncbi:Ornithine carbamoyltransferase [subsurface metagenome]|nr:ornithine carbamoyltransferase [Hadesarchaea archaeon]TES83636.1 MAG: ornithine carbamoyltransferase [Hadesarchaea archaeon]